MKAPDLFLSMFDSLFWARDRVLDTADGLSDDDFGRDNGFSEKSIRGALIHTLATEVMYIARANGETPPAPDSPEAVNETTCPSVAALRARWQEQEPVTRGVIAGLTEESLESEIVFRRRDGTEVRQQLWQVLLTLYQHSLQHRSEAAEALSLIGRSPGGLDFPVYLQSLNEA